MTVSLSHPSEAKAIATVERRLGRLESRHGTPQARWITPTLLNGCASVGAPFAPFGWQVQPGAAIGFRGRLSIPASGVVAFEIPLVVDPSDPEAKKFPHARHDFERLMLVEVAGARTLASLAFDSSTGEVVAHVLT